MKIESRQELGLKFSKYKVHTNTSSIRGLETLGIGVAGSYQPTSGCQPQAQPWYALAFGMDNRRVILTLDHTELLSLRDQIDRVLSEVSIRRVK